MPGLLLSHTRVYVPMLLGMWNRQLVRGGHPTGTASLPGGQCQGHGCRVQLQAVAPSLQAGQAGCVSGLLSPHRLFSERQQLNYRLHSVSCTGTEVHLSMCTFDFYRGNASAACRAGMPAVVSCVPGPLFTTANGHKKKQRQQQQGQVSPAERGTSPAVSHGWPLPCCTALCSRLQPRAGLSVPG